MLRKIGIVFGLLAIVLLGHDVLRSVQAGAWTPFAFGELWYRVHPGSLQLLQPAVERHLHPALWDPWIQGVLVGPAFAVPLVIALVLLMLARAFRPRRRRGLLD
ncbi:MAG: hypothetical protein AAFS07_03245 [Pseudomonadota bacterium]